MIKNAQKRFYIFSYYFSMQLVIPIVFIIILNVNDRYILYFEHPFDQL